MNTLEKAKKEIAEIINYNKAQREKFNKKKEEISCKIEHYRSEISNLQKELDEVELPEKYVNCNAVLKDLHDVVYNEAKSRYGKMIKPKDSVPVISLLSVNYHGDNSTLIKTVHKAIKDGEVDRVVEVMRYNAYLYKISFNSLLSNIKNKYEVIEYEYEQSITIKKEEVINNIPVVVYSKLTIEEILALSEETTKKQNGNTDEKYNFFKNTNEYTLLDIIRM